MSSAVDTTAAATIETSRAIGERLHDSARVAGLRAAAARAFAGMGMPDSRAERPWKYLDVSRLDLDAYQPWVESSGAGAPVETEASGVLRQVDGETQSVEVRGEGLVLAAFDRADELMQATIDRALATAVPHDRSRFTAAHYAFLRGGVLVEVAANSELDAPVFLDRRFNAAGHLGTPHTLIVTGSNSRVSVVDDFRSSDEDMVILPVVEILPGPGSEVRYTALHRWGAQTRVFAEQRTVTERDSTVISLGLATGGQVVKSHIESSLVGRGSASVLLGLTVGSASQHLDFYTLQDHIGPDTRSDLLFKAALKGRSRAVYYGLTRVGLKARNADANQENRNILLSKEAKADSDPVLEILTNDVIRVSHGATAGPVDEEQLYYLESRAIAPADAEALLVHAFLNQVLDRVPDETLRAELELAIDQKLEA